MIKGPIDLHGIGDTLLKGGIKGFDFTFEATDPNSVLSRITFRYMTFTWYSNSLTENETDAYRFLQCYRGD